jgi:hypothetical protein
VYSSVFGGRETLEVLRGWKDLCWRLKGWFLELLRTGLRLLEVLSFSSVLDFLGSCIA